MSEAIDTIAAIDALVVDILDGALEEARGGPWRKVDASELTEEQLADILGKDPGAVLREDADSHEPILVRVRVLREDGTPPPRVTLWLAVDELSKHYGGPQEGGWWYTDGAVMWSEPMRVFYDGNRYPYVPKGEIEFLRIVAAEWLEQFEFGTTHRSSMAPQGRDFMWRVVAEVPEDWSGYSPYC